MPVIHPIIRPPSEADSFLLQITTGCSSNTCSFCGAYRDKKFTIKDLPEIIDDIDLMATRDLGVRRVFLMDGDALAVKNKLLLPVLSRLKRSFPRIKRISSYANDYNILSRSAEELKTLSDLGLKLIYIGLESGSQKILDACGKRSTVKGMIETVRKAGEAGIKSSVIALLGLGGRHSSREHAVKTAEAVNAMQPDFLSLLSLMLIPGTPLYESARQGRFIELNPSELLMEMQDILSMLELKRTVFFANHASNYLSLEGRLPGDKNRMLETIKAALEGRKSLRPENSRGL
ncbi:MAG: radical SAM protein [Spirochaetales bacterium]|nr:radical SAM protein [Spirochaetales bacterium]